MPTDLVFDFHNHISLKASLTQGKKTSWDKIELKTTGLLAKAAKNFGESLNSQANLKQLKAGNVKISVCTFYGTEKAFAESKIFQDLVPQISPLNGQYLKDINTGKISYYKAFENDMGQLIMDMLNPPSDCKDCHYLFVDSVDQIDIADTKTSYIIPVFEGLHCFKNFNKPEDEPLSATEFNNVLTLFNEFRKLHRPLYATITHHSKQPFCTSTYGVRILLANAVVILGNDHSFKPAGFGINSNGYKMLEACYHPEDPNIKPTLVDIKHMSLVSRKQFFSWRKNPNYPERLKMPIVASHVGFTGFSSTKIPVEKIKNSLMGQMGFDKIIHHTPYIRKGHINGTLFNPWTVNLFDEEILEILSSDGFFGLSLDRRVIGAGNVFDEYFSEDEYHYLNKELKSFTETVDAALWELPYKEKFEASDFDNVYDGKVEFAPDTVSADLHIKFFVNQLLHVVRVGIANGFNGTVVGKPNVWNKVGIGSDMDGLVDPIYLGNANTLFTSDKFATLKSLVKTELQNSIAADHSFNYQLPGNDAGLAMDKLFFSNAFDFLKKYYK